jgi:IKI3 family.
MENISINGYEVYLFYRGLIIFWEKNGLRHLEFVLPYISSKGEKPEQADETNLDIEHMQWNKESDLLALWAR